MSTVATKPRKSAPTLPGAAAPAVYKRPESTYHPEIGKTADERLATLRATLRTADEKLEAAYDAAERGSAVDVLLELVAHDLMCTVLSPILRADDEADIPVTKGDIAAAHTCLFPLLAAIEGAMALAVGTVLSATLAEAFNLLAWAQDECDSTALGALMPDAVETDPKPATQKPAWVDICTTAGGISDARILLEMLLQEAGFSYGDPDDSKAAQSRIFVLANAMDHLLMTTESEFDEMVTKLQGAAS